MAAAVKRAFADGPSGQVHYRVAGSGNSAPAVVCLHMSPKSGRLFAEVLPHLAQGRTAVAPDYPGHGESDLPPAEPPATIADFADAVEAVIDTMAIDRYHVVGHHTGAMVAAELAWRRPDRVLSVVSLSAPVFTDDELAELAGRYAPIAIDEAGTRFTTLWQRVLAHRGPGMTLGMAAVSFAENLRAGDAYEWGHRAAFAYGATYRERLAAIDQPVVVLNPADDCEHVSRRADSLLKNGSRIDKPEWGHGFLSAFPEEAAHVINRFIEGADRNG